MLYLQLAGFGDVALIQRFDLRPNLISALVERWCTETHTFIMPCGEYTITLEDVSMQLGLRVDGAVVTGRSKVWELSVLCHRLLGRYPNNEEQNFTCLKLTWLRANFKELSSTATEYEVMCATRAYIKQLTGVLTSLYYEICRATKYGVSNMMGHISVNWCEPNLNHLQPNDRGVCPRKFLWMMYSALNIATLIPQWVHAETYMWCINTPVLNFSTIKWYKALWNAQYDRRLEMHSCMFDFSPSTEYMQWFMTGWKVYLFGGQLMIVMPHGYRRGNQPIGELEDQHIVEPD
ncbi:hypothetical protein J1N35_034557 [Gossypium stocksii]|uniref:Aminotransferase-like plant mobile domain-containing protein n=1 Tax=Gossypium stocksii TaxID=47602 RepID=A0A9D3USA2_9ROSI|nr:hypothetical protein J1N35_034557 [Gossypium stocksii]